MTKVLRKSDMVERRERFGTRRLPAYNPERALKICELIAKGQSLREICAQPDMPARNTFWRWTMLYKDVAAAYKAARELSAQAMEDEALEMARELKDPHPDQPFTASRIRAYDIAMQQLRWSAARRDPSRYGQRAEKTITVPIQINTSLDLGAQKSDGTGIYSISAKIVPPDGTDALAIPDEPVRGMIAKGTSHGIT